MLLKEVSVIQALNDNYDLFFAKKAKKVFGEASKKCRL